MNLSEAAEQLQRVEVTSAELVKACLSRIETVDRAGPKLNAVIEVNPDALEIAARLDVERKGGKNRGPLHGIPILLKDNIDTADEMMTTAGSLALEGSVAARDAFLAGRLREAGAVILGKTNLSEWANFRSSHSVSGWSSRGGQTRNPYALDRSPCGSSSGSAVAVAADLCFGAVGTETDGSIVCPSHTNGIVGLKPTLGLVSRSGIIPIAHSQDTAGPMGRSVLDVALLLGAMSGMDERDPATASSQGKAQSDYTQFLQESGLQGLRIGVGRDFFGDHPEVDRVIEDCLPVLKELGAELVDPVKLPTARKIGKTELLVLLYEFKADLNAYLGGLGPNVRVHSLAEVIAFNEANKDLVMPYFGQERMLEAHEKGSLTRATYQKALATNHRLTRAEGIDAAMKEHRLDAILAPTGQPAWMVDFINGDCGEGGCSSMAAVAGYPHITVPAGFVHGLPVGISFFGTAYSEPVLLRVAHAFERATTARRKPEFLPTVPFRV